MAHYIDNLHKTFQDMRFQAAKAIALHLLQENAHDSNLLADISEVNYTQRHCGCTMLHVQQLEGLAPFANKIYIFSYEHQDNFVFVSGRHLCTTAKDASTSKLIANIGMALAEAYNLIKNPHTMIVHTIAREGAPTRIRDTIAEIEAGTDLLV